MGSISDNAPLIVLVGQTAGGKSALALALAKKFNGEIICADSRTIYKAMDIGTAKPSTQDQLWVPHHLLDIANPDDPISVAYFKKLAVQAIDDITARGKIPFLVGGTGLYIDAILYDFSFRPPADVEKRESLEGLSVLELQELLQAEGIELPSNHKNPRHLIRSLETGGQRSQRGVLRQNTLLLGLKVEAEQLKDQIVLRTNQMLAAGLEGEVRSLIKRYGWETRAFQTIGYKEFRPYFEGVCDLQEVEKAIIQNTWQYARRQKTWFKRDKHIHWICNVEETVDLITTHLNK